MQTVVRLRAAFGWLLMWTFLDIFVHPIFVGWGWFVGISTRDLLHEDFSIALFLGALWFTSSLRIPADDK